MQPFRPDTNVAKVCNGLRAKITIRRMHAHWAWIGEKDGEARGGAQFRHLNCAPRVRPKPPKARGGAQFRYLNCAPRLGPKPPKARGGAQFRYLNCAPPRGAQPPYLEVSAETSGLEA